MSLPNPSTQNIRLTQYSHGAGCGCKISPAVLDEILSRTGQTENMFRHLLVGNKQRDDAAVMDLGDGSALISTTDFFMPIVDDAFTFGKIAATNAISDVYAMGGRPLMAIAILGWPVDKLPPALAGEVVRGGQSACEAAGIPLAGGHSIDSPEPIFGLAVNGSVKIDHIKKNGGARAGDVLFLTKPLGIGILTTAQKKGLLRPEHAELAPDLMVQLNSIGETLGTWPSVHAMTDVTGFGLAGHLLEMCRASQTTARIEYDALPMIDPVIQSYITQQCIPGGTHRNWSSFKNEINLSDPAFVNLICDPQTSGGLLIAVAPEMAGDLQKALSNAGLVSKPIGEMTNPAEVAVQVI